MSKGEGRSTGTFATRSLNMNVRSSRSPVCLIHWFSILSFSSNCTAFWFYCLLFVNNKPFISLKARAISVSLKQPQVCFVIRFNLKGKRLIRSEGTPDNLSYPKSLYIPVPSLESMYFRVNSSFCRCCVRLLFSTTNASRPVQWTTVKILYNYYATFAIQRRNRSVVHSWLPCWADFVYQFSWILASSLFPYYSQPIPFLLPIH